jgi:hypothetical protein
VGILSRISVTSSARRILGRFFDPVDSLLETPSTGSSVGDRSCSVDAQLRSRGLSLNEYKRRILGVCLQLIVALLLFMAAPAFASDGALEINQTCAVQTGCVSGDLAGYPVTISQPGGYVLTSNLTVSSESLGGIEIASSYVKLDLNGFKVEGAGITSSTTGIKAIGALQKAGVAVHNGMVSNFSTGIDLGYQSRVESVRVTHFSEIGIRVDGDVSDCLVDEKGSPNSGIGISASGAITNNRVAAGSGINHSGSGAHGTTEGNNVVATNSGIVSSSQISSNRVISGGDGLAGFDFRNNLVEAGSTPVRGTIDMGGNVCNGVICPAVTALKLRNADTDRFVETVENGDDFSISAVGGCLAIQVELNDSATSLRYDWTPPGGTEVEAYFWENNKPFCWHKDIGWAFSPEVADCDCSSEMAQLGDHQVEFTPCSVDVNFGAGETCVGNGGVEGSSTYVIFTIEP